MNKQAMRQHIWKLMCNHWVSYLEIGFDYDLDAETLVGLTDDRLNHHRITDYFSDDELHTMAINFVDSYDDDDFETNYDVELPL